METWSAMKLWAPEIVISLVRDRNLQAHDFTGMKTFRSGFARLLARTNSYFAGAWCLSL